MSAEEPIYTAAVVIIGNEVLSGRIQDANLHFLAGELKAGGIRLGEAAGAEVEALVRSLGAEPTVTDGEQRPPED